MKTVRETAMWLLIMVFAAMPVATYAAESGCHQNMWGLDPATGQSMNCTLFDYSDYCYYDCDMSHCDIGVCMQLWDAMQVNNPPSYII